MIRNNIADYEDSYPRLAPSPTTVVEQTSTKLQSAVPELSLIFTNDEKILTPSLSTVKQNKCIYSSGFNVTIPSKASVPELSVLQSNQKSNEHFGLHDDFTLKCVSNRNSGQCSLPTDTFSVFKKEFDKKIASNLIKTTENLNSAKHSMPIQFTECDKNSSNCETTEIKKKNEIDIQNKINIGASKLNAEVGTEKLHHCNCSTSENMSARITELADEIKNMSVDIKQIQYDFRSFEKNIKDDLPKILTEIISKQFFLIRDDINPLQREEKEFDTSLTKTISPEREFHMKDNIRFKSKIYEKSPKPKIFERSADEDLLTDVNAFLVAKKTNLNENSKKVFAHNLLETLPENSPLIIPSDRSLVMQKLAEKYLPQNYCKNFILNLNAEKSDQKYLNELSFGSYDYMRKYNLVLDSQSDNMETECKKGKDFLRENFLFLKHTEKEPKFS
ncbi:uncharacterized protein LOC129614950 [Condylostylus longicornis]|uniref:uncharacterized protein LOC129614950 n=1 Tax=Condylostylus longicornis TaxID=2530218 RepID=UPI00244E00F6|nr:uncharacterized protein LOC129614950 [Condylostylus longicornis]